MTTLISVPAGEARQPTDPTSQALEDVLDRFGALARHAGRRHGVPAAMLDEVVQEVRIRLWRTLADGEKIRQAPASYVYRTAVSAALDLIRRGRTRRAHICRSGAPMDAIVDERARPEAALEHEETCRAIEQAIERLVETRRVPVRLHLAGYAREEMAELLGWSEARTRNLLYRGLADLRALLGEGDTRSLEARCRTEEEAIAGHRRSCTRVSSRSAPCAPSSTASPRRPSGSTCSTS